MAGLDDIKGLLQPKWFRDSTILYSSGPYFHERQSLFW